jgi:hypothetical protein
MFDEATDYFKAASGLADQARHARKTGNYVWLSRLQRLGETLAEHVIEFTKKAVTLAAVKLVIELCAMAIKKLMEFVTNKFALSMDITTTGIAYTGDKKYVPGQTPSSTSSSPFDLSSFSGARSGISYM